MLNTEELLDFMKKYDIESRTIKYYKEYMRNYKKEEPDDFKKAFKNIDVGKIDLRFGSIALKAIFFDNIVFEVQAGLNMYYDNMKIGIYLAVFTLDGKVSDDTIYFC